MSDELHAEKRDDNANTADASELAFHLLLSAIRRIDGLAEDADRKLQDLYESGVEIRPEDVLAAAPARGQEAEDEFADHQED